MGRSPHTTRTNTQIISFAKANLGVKPSDDIEADEQVRFNW